MIDASESNREDFLFHTLNAKVTSPKEYLIYANDIVNSIVKDKKLMKKQGELDNLEMILKHLSISS